MCRRLALIYANGGGFGHLTRAISLARQLAKAEWSTSIVTNSPLVNVLLDPAFEPSISICDGIEFHAISPNGPREDVIQSVHDIFARNDFDLLVVDTFPRGIAGELPSLLHSMVAKKVFVHRDINPNYVRQFDLAGAAKHFDLMLSPGELGPLSASAVVTEPWLVLDPDELLDSQSARDSLLIERDDNRLVVVVSGCGKPDEQFAMRRMATRIADHFGDRLNVRYAHPSSAMDSNICIWPLLHVHRGIDVLIGAGGYNTVNECRATGTPLLALPRNRLYDRQHERVSAVEYSSEDVVLPKLEKILDSPRTKQRSTSYSNGAHQAAELITTTLF